MKNKSLIYKTWLFWVVIIVVIIFIISLIIFIGNSKNPMVNNTSPQINPPAEEPIINNTIPLVITSNKNLTLGKSLKLTIKAANPQYRQGLDIIILYTLENTGNGTISITSDVINGIVVKNSGNRIIDYTGNSSSVKVLTDSYSIDAGQKKTGSFIIKSNDYNFFTNGNQNDGYYNSVYVYVGDVNSNIVVMRFIK